MRKSAIISTIILTAVLTSAPCWAEPGVVEPATASYNPWLAAGITMAALPVGGAIPIAVGQMGAFGTTVIAVPVLSAGHFYADEPGRGAAFAGGSVLLYLATATAYVWQYGGRSFPGPEAARPHEEAAARYVTAYYAGSAIYTVLAAWDAYRIAEEKNHGTK